MDLFDLAAKITLDTSEYERGLNDASGKTASFGEKLKGGFATAAKVGVAAISAAATAVGTLIKSSVEGYAEYEQLVGGIETLFGESADKVQEYAANAFRTAGLSANEYMSTVTSFSASLLQSLGGDTAAAADYADMAISDMSDNANKMGTDMELIQSAYQGFAKQNYTMLDNLKLGYGGTKTEMERLITDAEALDSSFTATRDANGDLAMSYADIVDAIHIVQDNMGITGTTAKEASTTIQGSISAMKSAWTNLVTGMADENANFGQLVDNFVESVVTVAGNLIPRVKQALVGVGTLITELAPVLTEQIPTLISEVLPSLLEAGVSLISSLGNAMIESLPMLINVAFELILTLANGLAESLPTLIPSIVDIILKIVETLTSPSNLSALIDAALRLIVALAEGLIRAIPQLLQAIPQIISNLVGSLVGSIPQLIASGIQLIVALGAGLIRAIPQLVAAIPSIILALVGGLVQGVSRIAQVGRQLVQGFWNGIKSSWSWLVSSVTGIFTGLLSRIKGLFGIHSPSRVFRDVVGKNLMLGLAEGIERNADVPLDAFSDVASDLTFGGVGTITATSGNGTSVGNNNITMNVYPSAGMDEERFAEYVAIKLNDMVIGRKAVTA